MLKWLRRIRGSSPGAAVAPAASPTAAPAAAPTGQPTALLDSEARLREGNRLLDEGRLEDAAACYRDALERAPMSMAARVNLSFVLMELGRVDEARTALRRAIEIEDSNADALFMLGRLASGRADWPEAVDCLQRAVAGQPGLLPAYPLLCRALVELGRVEAARSVAIQGLQRSPDSPDLLQALGNIQLEQGDVQAAVITFRSVLLLEPASPDLRVSLGWALLRAGHTDEAGQRLREALGSPPRLPEACLQLGDGLHQLGALEEAIAAYRLALDRNARLAGACENLGIALQSQGKWAAALQSYERLVALRPQAPEPLCLLGSAHAALGDDVHAEECFRQALRGSPDHAPAHAHLAGVLFDRGDVDAALRGFEQAVALDPDFIEARSNQLFLLSFTASPQHYLQAARDYGRRVTARARPWSDWLTPSLPGSPPRRVLRLGLVSGDLRAHPVGFFIERVLQHLDRRLVDVVAFPTAAHNDEVTARLKTNLAAWQPLTGMDDETAARRIRAQSIDVLIDLAGHTAHNRLPVFAWRPAPLQLTWLGYFASTGVPAIDWLLADEAGVPAAIAEHFSEAVWHLPQTRLCFSEPGSPGAHRVSVPPALTRGHITFGCNQNLAKINDDVLSVWRALLDQLPTARLRLQNKQTGAVAQRQRIVDRVTAAGIDPARLVLVPPAARPEYLDGHREIDLLLDTFPFTGGTTTCEALWMGVPTVTLAGSTMLARQGAGLMSAAGLADWIAVDRQDYVRLALSRARDLDALAQLRTVLRAQVLASPLFDSRRFAAQWTQVVLDIWQQGPQRRH